MLKKNLAIGSVLALVSYSALAQVKVGVILGTTGPSASLGIPFKNTFSTLPDTLGGQPVEYIVMDDASDITNSVKIARKLISDNKVDLIMGTSNVPASTSVAHVAQETSTPQLALSPLAREAAQNSWAFPIPQPLGVVMSVVAEHMKKDDVKKIAYIGFSDSWGDLVLGGLKPHLETHGIELAVDERYGRIDNSVVGQVLKVMAAKPDAVVIGGSGTGSALPHVTLVDRGYKGLIYHNHAVINKDFVRITGNKLDGAFAPTGPVIVAEQLPEGNPIKPVALEFTKAYEDHYGPGTRNAFSAYAYDAYKLADAAVAVAATKASPGTKEFREAVREALEQSKEVVGTHAIYNMSPTDHSGVDERSRVLVRAEKGEWVLVE